MPTLRKVIVKMTGNNLGQKFLEKTVRVCQSLMGVGSGYPVDSSGEMAVLALLPQKFEGPYCIFDVGSNQGQYLNLILRKLSTQSLTVHCFEPSSAAFDTLRKLNLEYKDSVRLNNMGLGRRKGELRLYYDYAGSGLASLTKRRLDHFGIEFNFSETVKIDTLDNYCRMNSINQIHLLKCDVEGHELDVFVGSSQMLSRGAIEIVTFEFGGCNIDTRSFFQDFYYFFKDVEMNISRITPSGYLQPVNSYSEMHEQFRTTNYVAMRRS